MTPRKPARPKPEAPQPAGAFHNVRDVCRMLGLEPYVLRYWERAFALKVRRNSAGRRIYSDAQVEEFRLIKRLIRQDKLTGKGTKQALARMRAASQQSLGLEDRGVRPAWLRKELLAIRGLLAPEDKPDRTRD